MISFIVPSYNNLKHLQNAYASIQKHAPGAEVILLDDGSTDGTWEWMQQKETESNNKTRIIKSETRIGHTILYDKGIELATNDIVGILHADMILGPNYVENMVKHLKPGTVVCATRVEPPLHPEGKEKIVMDFGQDFDTLNIPGFESYCAELQVSHKDTTTKGMFAPWILYKKDFQAIGGHDPLFAPFPYEDSDIFQRWILAGYNLVQSRDAFVYHLTCRGHRWNQQIGVDDNYYIRVSQRAARNYLRKWGSWIKNDEYQYPIIPHKYNIAFVVKNINLQLMEVLEPWCDRLYVNEQCKLEVESYIAKEQPNTKYDLYKRIVYIENNYPEGENDIVVTFDVKKFTNQSYNIIQNLSEIITESGEVGTFELDCFEIMINNLQTYEKDLIVCNTTS
jgi:glycosyltransferase involved in cell wall biosynthesis